MFNFQVAALTIPCSRCGALPAEDCKTSTGNVAQTHNARLEPLRIAYGEGYSEGHDDGKLRYGS